LPTHNPMNEVIDKISSYNIFNNLFPGILFAVLGESFTSYSFMTGNILVGLFLYYFYGLVISRIGSMGIEKLLRRTGFVTFAPYDEYLSASKIDHKIDQLSTENNMYRTMISTFSCLIALIIFESIEQKFDVPHELLFLIGAGLLLVLFAYSYRKQTNYIKDRVNNANGEQKD